MPTALQSKPQPGCSIDGRSHAEAQSRREANRFFSDIAFATNIPFLSFPSRLHVIAGDKAIDLCVQYERRRRYTDTCKAVSCRNRNARLLDRADRTVANRHHALAATSGPTSRRHLHARRLAEL